MPVRQVLQATGRRLLVRPRTFGSGRFSSTQAPISPSTKYTSVTHPDVLESVSASTQEVLDRGSKYILPVYARHPFVLSHGKGAYVWDTEGRKFLDFSAGIAVNALGHADEGVAKVLGEQAEKLLHTSNLFHNEAAGKLAELLVTLTQREGGLGWGASAKVYVANADGGLDLDPSSTTTASSATGAKVFFANSGTEANEGALKIARKVGKERWATANGKPWDDPSCDKFEIVCFENGFHGRSIGSLSVTSNPKYQNPFAPLVPGVKVGKLNVIEDVERLVDNGTCAVIVEPVQGEGGLHAADIDWLRALRKRCDEVGAVLIYDEIQCGLFRTGKLWAHSALPVECHPDIITMAKPLANGYPIGAVMMRDSIAEVMSVGTHGTTFGGSPLACAVGYHVLSRLSDHAFLDQLEETGRYLHGRLSQLPRLSPT